MWKYYALLSAFFAALTAIFAKVGVKNINSDLATAIRTSVILLITWGIVFSERQVVNVKHVDTHTWLFFNICRVRLPVCPGCFILRLCRQAMYQEWRLLTN